MFTRIHVQNFKCFSDLEIDLTHRGGQPKHLVMIYGENGAGKSNIAAIFHALMELLHTMDISEIYQFIMERATAEKDMDLYQAIKANVRDIPAIVRDFQMVGAEGNIVLEFAFSLDGKNGSYCIELSQDEVVHERLEYVLEKRRAVYFDIRSDKGSVKESIFRSGEFFQDVTAELKKYWGKHPFLSIIFHEMESKSKKYVEDSISENFRRVLDFFASVNGAVKRGNESRPFARSFTFEFFDLNSGQIPTNAAETQLQQAEKLVRSFFTAINSDIQDVYYKLTPYQDNSSTYQLYFKKMICGKVRDISFQQESTGNAEMLAFLSNLLFAASGGVEILDEMDSGIHDIAAQKILQELFPVLQGQLIITTHNTLLLDCDFAKEATYILKEDESANRYLECVADGDERIYQKTNIRKKYLDGDFKGVPKVGSLNFAEMIQYLPK